MDHGVVVCEDIELGAQEVVTKPICDCPFKGQEFQLHAGVVGLCSSLWDTAVDLRRPSPFSAHLDLEISRMKGLVNYSNPRTGAVVRSVFSSSKAFWCCWSHSMKMSAPFFL